MKLPPLGRSNDPSHFCKGRVDPYGRRLLPICCPGREWADLRGITVRSGRVSAPAAHRLQSVAFPISNSNIAPSQFEELPTFVYAQACHTVGFLRCSKFRSVGRHWVDPVQEAAAPGGRPDCIRTYGYLGHIW